MFTGLVETTGTVESLNPIENGARLTLLAPGLAGELALGDSLAVNGCCLTVNAPPTRDSVSFDLLAQTLRVTGLGDLAPGDPVNLERALRADARLGGHFVQGHVDATGTIVSYELEGQDHKLVVRFPDQFRRHVIPKGSIAIDGISLTAAELDDDKGTVTAWITPHTDKATHLHSAKAAQKVNLEFDLLAKYVERLLGERD